MILEITQHNKLYFSEIPENPPKFSHLDFPSIHQKHFKSFFYATYYINIQALLTSCELVLVVAQSVRFTFDISTNQN